MSASRVAAWIGFTGLLGAWLASAAGLPRSTPRVPAMRRPADAVLLDQLATDVQSQTGRLRTRLAAAPAPTAATRNPFSFSAPPAIRLAKPAPAAPVDLPMVLPEPEPMLELIGIAGDSGTGTLVRTAMISGPANELIMVTPGKRILGLYDVVAVGADIVELKHVTSGALRHLALR
ncbi:MAG: hypothetical protein ABI039_00715 [Vicinamibacterales bacterium]